MVWYGMVWYGMVWYGMVWHGMVWYGMVWYGMVWYGMAWYGTVWHDMAWHGMVWGHAALRLAKRTPFCLHLVTKSVCVVAPNGSPTTSCSRSHSTEDMVSIWSAHGQHTVST